MLIGKLLEKESICTYDDWPRQSSVEEEQNWQWQNFKGNKARNLRREMHSIGSNGRENRIERFGLVSIA